MNLDRFLTLVDVLEITTMGKTMLYESIKKGDFPKAYYVTPHKKAWSEKEVGDWINNIKSITINDNDNDENET